MAKTRKGKRTAMGIIEDWGLSTEELNEILSYRPSVRGMLMGFVAEYRLTRLWFSDARIHGWKRYDNHDRKRHGDFGFTYQGVPFSVEVKSLQSNSVEHIQSLSGGEDRYIGKVQCDASDSKPKTLPNGQKLKTTCLVVGGFDLLAVNLFEFGQEWKFGFAKNSDLPRSKFKKYTPVQQKYLLATSVRVTWPLESPFRDEPFSLLGEIVREKRGKPKKQ